MKPAPAFALTVARFTVLDAVRGRLVLPVACVLALAWGIALFIPRVALTEVMEIQATIMAAIERLCAVFLLMTLVVSAIRREYDERVVELLLAYPGRRSGYAIGKMLGYAGIGWAFALVFSLPLLGLAPAARVLLWGVSLGLELQLVSAAALFCALSLRSVTAALAAVAGFYTLGRSVDAMLVIAGTAKPSEGWQGLAAYWLAELTGLLIPHLDRVTQSAWLNGAPPDLRAAGLGAAQLIACALVLLAAGLFDLERQNF
jgi:hypothetical protein